MKLITKIDSIYADPEDHSKRMLLNIVDGDLSQFNEADLTLTYDVELKPHRKARTKDANAYLWECITQIANVLGSDKREVYLDMLHHYGKCVHIVIEKEAYKDLQNAWRTCEVLDEALVKGKAFYTVACYYGSSTYNREEFSKLIEGTLSEMEQVGLPKPPSKEILEAIRKINEVNNPE